MKLFSLKRTSHQEPSQVILIMNNYVNFLALDFKWIILYFKKDKMRQRNNIDI